MFVIYIFQYDLLELDLNLKANRRKIYFIRIILYPNYENDLYACGKINSIFISYFWYASIIMHKFFYKETILINLLL